VNAGAFDLLGKMLIAIRPQRGAQLLRELRQELSEAQVVSPDKQFQRLRSGPLERRVGFLSPGDFIA
jgi:hypothetical protein